MRILALAERALDKDARLRLPLYSRSRSNDSVEKAKVNESEGIKDKQSERNPKKVKVSDVVSSSSVKVDVNGFSDCERGEWGWVKAMRMNLCQAIQGSGCWDSMWGCRDAATTEPAGSLLREDTSRPSLPGSWRTVPKIRPSCCTEKVKIQFQILNFRDQLLTFVKGPANLHNPPKPHDCRKWSGCWEASSDASMFWMMLWTAASTTWSFDDDKTLLIFWSSSEWLWKWIFSLQKVQAQ